MRVRAAQHVFGSLTSTQFPFRRPGFQTLFYTRHLLTEAEAQAIERRAQYHVTRDGTRKWQFYWLSPEKAVVARLTPIAEPDEFGRKGRYLSHSLVVRADDLQRLDGAPFDLMRDDRFYTTIDAALSVGDLQTGEMPDAALDVTGDWFDQSLELVRDWPSDQLGALVRLVCQSRATVERRKHVAMLGDAEQALNALRVAFMLAPPEMRRFCSFDTSSSGCDWPRDVVFWGQGFAAEREARTQLIIDAALRQVRLGAPQQFPPSAYAQWIEEEVKAGRVKDSLGDQERAQTLAAFLQGKDVDWRSLSGMGADFKLHFAEANSDLLDNRIVRFLPEGVSPNLSRAFLSQFGSSPLERLQWLLDNRYGEGVNEVLYKTLLQDSVQRPSGADLNLLKASAREHSGLELLLALWSDDEQGQRHSLTGMRKDEYRARVKDLSSWSDFAAWRLFTPVHFSSWRDLCGSSFDDLVKGLSAVAKHGNSWEQKQAGEIITELEITDQRRLLQWLESSRLNFPLLRAGLEQSLNPPSQWVTVEEIPDRRWFNPLGWFHSSRGSPRPPLKDPARRDQLKLAFAIVLGLLIGMALGFWLILRPPPFFGGSKKVTLNGNAQLCESPNGKVIRTLKAGSSVTILEEAATIESKKWIKVTIEGFDSTTPNGKTKPGENRTALKEGWVKEEFLRP